MKPRRRRPGITGEARRLCVWAGDAPDWQAEVRTLLTREGYATDHVAQLEAALPLIEAGRVQALLVAARPLAASDLLLLRRIRAASPGTAIVVVSKTPSDPDLKRAFESGATVFLSWPSSPEALRHAVDSGQPGGPGARGSPAHPMGQEAGPPSAPPVSDRGRN